MKSLTSKDLIVIAGIIVLGVVLFSATVIVRLVNTPVSTAPVITAETNNVQSYQVPEPQYNKCDADILANKIKNNCCEKSFETGLFDQDALVGIKRAKEQFGLETEIIWGKSPDESGEVKNVSED